MRDMDRKVVEPYQNVSNKVQTAKKCLEHYREAYSAYERAHQNAEQQAKKKAAAAVLVRAQEEESAALKEYSKAQKDTVAAQCRACSLANQQCPEGFGAAYALLQSLFRRGHAMLSDMDATQQELAREHAELSSALATAAPDADTETKVAEQLEELTVGESKYATLLSALREVAQRFADEGLPRCPPRDVAALVDALGPLCELHVDLKGALLQAAASGGADRSKAVADAFSALCPRFERLYGAYVDQLPFAGALYEKYQDAKGFRPVRRLHDQLCRETGLTNDDVVSALAAPCRHPAALLLVLRRLLSLTPTAADGWSALAEVAERWALFCETLDRAKRLADQTQELVRLRDTLPGVADLVTKSRVFQLDGEVTCISCERRLPPADAAAAHSAFAAPVAPADSGPSSPTSPTASGIVGPSSSSSSSSSSASSIARQIRKTISNSAISEFEDLGKESQEGQQQQQQEEQQQQQQQEEDKPELEVKKKYRMYLFNDIVLFAVPQTKKSGLMPAALSSSLSSLSSSAAERTYAVRQRYRTRDLTIVPEADGAADDGAYVFGMAHPGGAFRLSVDSLDKKMLWMAYLERTITERNKRYVFGVALDALMARREEQGSDVPRVLADAAAYVAEHGRTAEGVFRLSCATTELDEAREEIDAGLTPKYTDVHVAACVIKLWLRALPEPLMTYALFDRWVAAKDSPAALRDVVAALPAANRVVLSAVVGLLAGLADAQEQTKMSASNLAIVVAPNVLYQRAERAFSSDPQTVVETLIRHHATVFAATEAQREQQRTERARAKRAERERRRTLQTTKSLCASPVAARAATRRVSPTAVALRQAFRLAAPQDTAIPPPPSPPPAVDIPPPPLAPPDIGPPADTPPPLLPPSPLDIPPPPLPEGSQVQGQGQGAEDVVPPTPGVLAGFSQSLVPPPSVLSPELADDIPPPPLPEKEKEGGEEESAAGEDAGKGKQTRQRPSGKTHRHRHRERRTDEGDAGHKSGSKTLRVRSKPPADAEGQEDEEDAAGTGGGRARSVSELAEGPVAALPEDDVPPPAEAP